MKTFELCVPDALYDSGDVEKGIIILPMLNIEPKDTLRLCRESGNGFVVRTVKNVINVPNLQYVILQPI